jgi:prevent-host-death family protein
VFAAMKAGVPVMLPAGEHGRVDLAFDVAERLWRVQVKWGRLSARGDVVIVKLEMSRRTADGHRRRLYREREIDLLAVYCGELDRCFLVPFSRVAGLREVYIRVLPARNGQQACTNLASDFDLDGAIAQLGERVTGSHEVVGSSPTSSINSWSAETLPTLLGSNPFRDRFGYWMDRVAAGEEVLVTRHGKPRVRLIPVD